MANPDEICGVCGETRENHGDKMHEFNAEGVLVPLKPAEPPKKDPPVERLDPEIKAAAFASLVEVLAEKQILHSKDIIRIFSARP